MPHSTRWAPPQPRAGVRVRGRRRHASVRDALAARAEELADKILAAYEAGLDADDPVVRVRSADVLMSRVFGRPKETIEQVKPPVPAELQAVRDMSAEEREELWRRLVAAEEGIDPQA